MSLHLNTVARELGFPNFTGTGLVAAALILASLCVPARFAGEAELVPLVMCLVAMTRDSSEGRALFVLSCAAQVVLAAREPAFLERASWSVTPVCVGRIAHAVSALVR